MPRGKRRSHDEFAMSQRSDAPGDYTTDHDAGASIHPHDSASQPGAAQRMTQQYNQRSKVTFADDGGESVVRSLVSHNAADDLTQEQIQEVKRYGGCDAVMNYNCIPVDLKVQVQRLQCNDLDAARRAGELRVEYSVIPTSKLMRLRSQLGEKRNKVLAHGETSWAYAGHGGVADFSSPRADWLRGGLKVPQHEMRPGPQDLNRRYIEFRVAQKTENGQVIQWSHRGGSARAELFYKAKDGQAKARRKAKLKLKDANDVDWELDAYVTMRPVADIPAGNAPRAAPSRKTRGAAPAEPPPYQELAPKQPGVYAVHPNDDDEVAQDYQEEPRADPIKIARNLGIGLVGGALLGAGIGAICGWFAGGSSSAAAAAGGASASKGASGGAAAAGAKSGAAAGAAGSASSGGTAAAAGNGAAHAGTAVSGAAAGGGHAAAAGGTHAAASGGSAGHAAASGGGASASGTTGASHGAVSLREPASGHLGANEDVATHPAAAAASTGMWAGGLAGLLGSIAAMAMMKDNTSHFCCPMVQPPPAAEDIP
eukprot:TRINITY_DN50332_c0_g1_i1.p1 TRINITY_DN50332_c0_g1~~TRINITY_DN50332_c0_g1_i1.p1  ORF type:complete len:539 (+),score=67.00 TRINITY_DN50332_c0_g1_i1:146-1762(+)